MKKWNSNSSILIMCLCEILVGVLLLINPVGFTSGIIVAFGIIVAAAGVMSVLRYFALSPEEAAVRQNLAAGLLGILGGCFCIIQADWLIVTFPILSILYGIVILVTGICRIQWAVDLLRMKKKYWYVTGIGAALSVILAVVVLLNPFTAAIVLWNFLGISLIVEAVADICALITRNKEGKG